MSSRVHRSTRADQGPNVTFRNLEGTRLCAVEPSSGRARAQAVFVHGLSEHAGRPLPFARQLAKLGVRTLIPELAGHGAPPSAPDAALDVYRAYAATTGAAATLAELRRVASDSGRALRRIPRQQYDALRAVDAERHLRQIAATLDTARRFDPALPVLLVGHSMGGLLSLEAAWRWTERPEADLRGVVLLSPALEPTPPRGKPLETLILETSWKLRDVPLSPLRSAVKGLLRLNLPIDTTAGNRWLSDQPDEVELYATDPLVPHRLPSGYVSSIETQMARTARRGSRFPLPGLVLVPGSDGITSAEAGVAFARSVQRAMGREHMRLERFAGICAHDLLRSSARDRVVACIGDWVERTLAPSSNLAA